MPQSSGIVFYSYKDSRQAKEKCVTELHFKDKKVKYVLNPKTRLFEEEKKPNKDAPSFVKDER